MNIHDMNAAILMEDGKTLIILFFWWILSRFYHIPKVANKYRFIEQLLPLIYPESAYNPDDTYHLLNE